MVSTTLVNLAFLIVGALITFGTTYFTQKRQWDREDDRQWDKELVELAAEFLRYTDMATKAMQLAKFADSDMPYLKERLKEVTDVIPEMERITWKFRLIASNETYFAASLTIVQTFAHLITENLTKELAAETESRLDDLQAAFVRSVRKSIRRPPPPEPGSVVRLPK